jgi:hypothetical protein
MLRDFKEADQWMQGNISSHTGIDENEIADYLADMRPISSE